MQLPSVIRPVCLLNCSPLSSATAVGDPPNVILVSTDWKVVRGEKDIEFAEFTAHMALGIGFVMGRW